MAGSRIIDLDENGKPVDPKDVSAQLFYYCTFMGSGGGTDVIEQLLGLGACVDVFCTKWGHTALAMAAETNSAAVADVLLRHGADTQATDKQGLTPFQIAANKSYPGPMEAFLRHGADANMKDAQGRTPLHIVLDGSAVNEARIEAVAILLRHNCWVDTPDNSGATAIDYIERKKQSPFGGSDWKAMCAKIETMLKEALPVQQPLRKEQETQAFANQFLAGTSQKVTTQRLRYKSAPGL